jgi:hypothetical protein
MISLALLLLSSTLGDQSRVLSLCEFIADLQSYNGKVVIVRAEFHGGPEQFYLSGGKCKKRFVTDGYIWLDAIHLALPGSREAPATLPFQPDFVALSGFLEQVKTATAKNGATRGCVTVEGMLQTRDKYQIVTAPDGTKKGWGFGQMGAFPAQLIPRNVKDARLQPWSRDAQCECCTPEPGP